MLTMINELFFESNRLTNPNFFILIIALICLITVAIPKKFFRIPLFIGVIWLSFQHYFPITNASGFQDWGRLFFENLLYESTSYSFSSPFYFPQRIALCVLLLIVIGLTTLLIDYNNWYVPYTFIVGFLLSLEVYLNQELIFEILMVTAATFSFILLRKDVMIKRGFVIKGLVVLLFSLSLGKVFPMFFESTHQRLVSLSTPLRSQLNTQGFYDQIQEFGLIIGRRTGFSDNDLNLGGPIADNHEVAFTVYQETGNYWRVETKSVYTGDGWDVGQERNFYSIEALPYLIADEFYVHSHGGQRHEAFIELDNDATFIPLPYGDAMLSSRVEGAQIPAGQLQHDLSNNRILNNQLTNAITQFEISATTFEFTPEELGNVSFTYTDTEFENLIEYLQLPPMLPERISELAQDLTAEADTVYEQVLAIQSHLKDSGNFRYSKTDAMFTPDGRDYVDYFLFDTPIGYCDNFSTSMVVLLRSLGIHSRWSKGFTQGNRTVLADEAFNQYTVLNSHAHSWVEVFFPGLGWVPFDPTPDYSYPYEPEDVEESNDLLTESEENQETDQPMEELEEEPETDTSVHDTDEEVLLHNDLEPDHKTPTVNHNWYVIILRLGAILIAIAAIILLLFIYKNFHWIRFSLYLNFWARDFEGIYKKLLKAYHSVEPRLPKEPLIEYANRVTILTHNDSFLLLTERFEESLYGDKTIAFGPHLQLFQDAAAILYKK